MGIKCLYLMVILKYSPWIFSVHHSWRRTHLKPLWHSTFRKTQETPPKGGLSPSKGFVSCKQNSPAAICTSSSDSLRTCLLFISPKIRRLICEKCDNWSCFYPDVVQRARRPDSSRHRVFLEVLGELGEWQWNARDFQRGLSFHQPCLSSQVKPYSPVWSQGGPHIFIAKN